jgi:hypothetical protein
LPSFQTPWFWQDREFELFAGDQFPVGGALA